MESNRVEFILVLGATGSGKTSFINDVSNSTLEVGHGLNSCTSTVYHSEPILVDGCKVVLFDTPGFDDTTKQDVEILTELSVFLGGFYELKQKLIGVLYLHDITSSRMGGTAVRNVRMFNRLVGKTAAKNILILTTKWDIVEPNIGEKRHRELAEDPNFFGAIIQEGATMWKHSRNEDPLTILFHIITNHRRTNIQFVEELESGIPIGGTGAGKILSEEIDAALKIAEEKHNEQVKRMEGLFKAQMEAEIKRVTDEMTKRHGEKIRELERQHAAIEAERRRQAEELARQKRAIKDEEERRARIIKAMREDHEREIAAQKERQRALERSYEEAKQTTTGKRIWRAVGTVLGTIVGAVVCVIF